MPQRVEEAWEHLKNAAKVDPQFADALVAAGDLRSAYAFYFTNQIAAYKKTITDDNKNLTDDQKCLTDKKQQLQALEHATPINPADIAQVKKQIADLKKQIADLDKQIADLTQKIKDLRKNVSDTREPAIKEIKRAAVHYRDSIQDDSGSNKGYLGRSKALQQLAYLIADKAVAAITIQTCCTEEAAKPSPSPCTTSPTTTSPTTTSSTTKSTTHAVTTDAATKSVTKSTTQSTTHSTTKSTTQDPAVQAPTPCPCCVIGDTARPSV